MEPNEKIRTSSGETYVGQVVIETADFVKIIIDKRDIVNIEKSKIILRENLDLKKRNHMISAELSNYYLMSFALNYDVNLYRYNDYVFGGSLSVGVAGIRAGSYAAYRLMWQDLLKAEIGFGSTAQWEDIFTGPYAEIAYRYQRDSHWFYWEVSAGSILDIHKKYHALPYINIGVGLSF